jgi:signal peptide peptidase SppA
LERRFGHLIQAVLARPWAIDERSPEWAAILDILELRASGGRLTEAEITARVAAAQNGPRAGEQTSGKVRVIPLYGVISPRMGLMNDMSGGTTAEGFSRAFRGAIADPEVSAIVLDVDSPGGNVFGIEEASSLVRQARGQKPISAVACHRAASAAYYIAAQADEVVVTPSGEVGSIGIIGQHQDFSEAEAKLGIKTTLISAGKFKTEGNPHIPLSDDAKAAWQADADRWYGMFVNAVAKGRGVSAETVRSDFGQGRMLLAKPALAAGMVDRIDTLEATIDRALAGKVRMRPVGASAEAEDRDVGAETGTPDEPEQAGTPGQTPAAPTSPPTEPAEAGSNPPARARSRHDLELIEALLRGGHGWLQ